MNSSSTERPELIELFDVYTGNVDSIGSHLASAAGRKFADAPLLVATATDLALYPGAGADAQVLGFRLSTRGFKELAAISHLGPALASLIALKEAEPEKRWRSDAERLLAHIDRAIAANTPALWRDVIAAEAYRGREQSIANMASYSLTVSGDYLRRGLTEPKRLCFETLRSDLLDDGSTLPVSLNRVMIATFFLVGMDISHRLIGWLDQQKIDWPRSMVLITGKQGRATSGLTWRTNSVAAMILAASRWRLPLTSLYIAPHASTFPTPTDGDLSQVQAMESQLRALWADTKAVVDLAGEMFPQYPAYVPDAVDVNEIGPDTTTVAEMPTIAGPHDWPAMVTRLRMVLEDPRQLLSSAVSDYAAAQLASVDNDPSAIIVPGLDEEPSSTGPMARWHGAKVVAGQIRSFGCTAYR